MSQSAQIIILSGSVQGVGFRFTACNVAKRYGLVGYVKNTRDGKVEILAQGYTEDIADCISDLKETFAIRDVKIQDCPVATEYTEFNIAF